MPPGQRLSYHIEKMIDPKILKKNNIPHQDSNMMMLIIDDTIHLYSSCFTFGQNDVVNVEFEKFIESLGYKLLIQDNIPTIIDQDGNKIEAVWHFPKSGIGGDSVCSLLKKETWLSSGSDLFYILQLYGYIEKNITEYDI